MPNKRNVLFFFFNKRIVIIMDLSSWIDPITKRTEEFLSQKWGKVMKPRILPLLY